MDDPGLVINDFLMMVGKEHYTVPQFIAEAKEWGVSKRIPINSIPEGLVPNLSRLFLWHPQAIPVINAPGRTYQDLAELLIQNGCIARDAIPEEILEGDPSNKGMIDLTCAFWSAEKDVQGDITAALDLTWQGGVFGYTSLQNPRVVLPDGVEELPENMKHLEGKVQLIHVKYQEEE
jgi:hypothetical protein